MIEPIDPLQKVTSKNLPGARGLNPTALNAVGSLLANGDQVSFNADSLLESVRSEVAGLTQDLPGLIRQSLLAPPGSQSAGREPLDALIFRLQDPLKTILGAVKDVPEEVLVKIQDELKLFKLIFPELKNNDLLAPFQQEPQTAGFLTDVLSALSLKVDDLIAGLGNR